MEHGILSLLPVFSLPLLRVRAEIGAEKHTGIYQYRIFSMSNEMIIETIRTTKYIDQASQHTSSLIVSPQRLLILTGSRIDKLYPAVMSTFEDGEHFEWRSCTLCIAPMQQARVCLLHPNRSRFVDEPGP